MRSDQYTPILAITPRRNIDFVRVPSSGGWETVSVTEAYCDRTAQIQPENGRVSLMQQQIAGCSRGSASFYGCLRSWAHSMAVRQARARKHSFRTSRQILLDANKESVDAELD